eukprot:TRINITY_DN18947_c0_g1_i1.p1 TRINITY_DN18947_c0_g1~~TRINITY_DN18947_c0_g1_i1.p1  ORF type:complete len:245 (-),score=39.71 TRINITY_DN18947_c0_g1_i1:111-845(-)
MSATGRDELTDEMPQGRQFSKFEMFLMGILIARSAIQIFGRSRAIIGSWTHGVWRRSRRWWQDRWRKPGQTTYCSFSAFGSETCSVCLGNFAAEVGAGQLEGESAEPLLRFPCEHLFHESCIMGWLERQDTCPVCRTEIDGLQECVLLMDRRCHVLTEQRSLIQVAVVVDEAAESVPSVAAEARTLSAAASAASDVQQQQLHTSEARNGMLEPMLLAGRDDDIESAIIGGGSVVPPGHTEVIAK